MAPETISATFAAEDIADSAIGRLEVLGVPSEAIEKTSSLGAQIKVVAVIEDRLVDKARDIVSAQALTSDRSEG